MGKGEETRRAILDRATTLASRIGIEGLTIGSLASTLGLSKSGLYAHFQSKEALQLQVLEFASELFSERVLRPALRAPRGEPRLRALFERWQAWATQNPKQSGCIFVGAAVELDDRPSVLRDRLVAMQKDWLELLANVVRTGIDEGHFRKDVDPEQMAYELNGATLGFHHAYRLMRDPQAQERAERQFERLLDSVRAAEVSRETH